jgi:hypothetical protein
VAVVAGDSGDSGDNIDSSDRGTNGTVFLRVYQILFSFIVSIGTIFLSCNSVLFRCSHAKFSGVPPSLVVANGANFSFRSPRDQIPPNYVRVWRKLDHGGEDNKREGKSTWKKIWASATTESRTGELRKIGLVERN